MNWSTSFALYRSYYDTASGIGYNTGRVNIGGCDFSPRAYTYDDNPGDVTLDQFALQTEDLDYKVVHAF